MKLINLTVLITFCFLLACSSIIPISNKQDEQSNIENQTTTSSNAKNKKSATPRTVNGNDYLPKNSNLPPPKPVELLLDNNETSPISTPLASSTPEDNEDANEDDDVESPRGRSAAFPNTIIVYQKASPSSDNTLQEWTIYHTGRITADEEGTEWQLSAERVRPLFDIVESESFWDLGESYAPADECTTCSIETLVVYWQDDIKEISVTQASGVNLPISLQEALEKINRFIALENNN